MKRLLTILLTLSLLLSPRCLRQREKRLRSRLTPTTAYTFPGAGARRFSARHD